MGHAHHTVTPADAGGRQLDARETGTLLKGVALDCGGAAAVSRPAAAPGSAALARARQLVQRMSATGDPHRACSPHRRLLAWAANARGVVVRGWGSTSTGVRWTQAGAIESPAVKTFEWARSCLLFRIERVAAPSLGDGARRLLRGVASPCGRGQAPAASCCGIDPETKLRRIKHLSQ